MRLCSLCGVLLLLCLYAVPGLAAGGQTVSIRRAHQPRKVDQIIHTRDQLLGQTTARKNPRPPKPPFGSKTVVIPRTIAPRKLLTNRNTFCRPKSCGSTTSANCQTSTSAKGSASLPEGGGWLYALTALGSVLLLSSG